MKKTNTLRFTTLLVCFSLFSFTGCEDKKVQEPLIVVENTTELLTQKDESQQEEKQEKSEVQESQKTSVTLETLETKKEPMSKEVTASQIPTDAFTLKDIQQNRHTFTISNRKITFHDIDQPIVIVNFFNTWCTPCRGEIPYLADLQKKYKKKLFIVGILVNDNQDNHALKEFISKHHADYFISNSKYNDAFAAKTVKELQLPENFPLPLTVIYKDGNYYTHYEGAVPIEMIDHDIQEAIKK